MPTVVASVTEPQSHNNVNNAIENALNAIKNTRDDVAVVAGCLVPQRISRYRHRSVEARPIEELPVKVNKNKTTSPPH